MKQISLLITGATGMVGEGVLHEAINDPLVEKILLVNRNATGVQHPKVKEILHKDFFNVTSVAPELKGYSACLFCLGVSSIGMSEDKYHHLTYDLTIHFAQTYLKENPGGIFCYISGGGTDSTEKGKSMWARVKGKTENKLLSMGFKDAYMFRPGFMQPTKGLKRTLKLYYIFKPIYPLLRKFFPAYVSTLRELGVAMIRVVRDGNVKKVLEVKDIVSIANQK